MWAAIVVTQTGALCARAQAPETGDRRHDLSAVDTPSTHGRFVPPEFASIDMDGKYTTYDLRGEYGKLFRSSGVSFQAFRKKNALCERKER